MYQIVSKAKIKLVSSNYVVLSFQSQSRTIDQLSIFEGLTLFDMGLFEPSVMGRDDSPHHNFVVIAPMIMTM